MSGDMIATVNTPRQRLADVAYSRLLHDITVGDLRPRDRLTELDMCARLHVSRTPVREALNRLVVEGLLVAIPHRGVTVRDLSLDEAIELFYVREAIETQAARMAAERIRDEELDELYALCDTMELLPNEMPAEYLFRHGRLEVRFHRRLVALGGVKALSDFYNDHHLIQMHIFGFHWVRVPGFLSFLLNPSQGSRHRPMVDALASRDPDKADRAVRAAVQQGIQAHRLAAEKYREALAATTQA